MQAIINLILDRAGKITLSRSVTILSSMAFAYVVYLPIALLLNAEDLKKQPAEPEGAVVKLGYFKLTSDADQAAAGRIKGRHIYMTAFRWTDKPGDPLPDGIKDTHVLLFENNRCLGSPFIQYLEYSKSYTFTFSASDNSDPNTNGRDYWLVRR